MGVNRPHTTLIGDRLITAGDELSSTGSGPPSVRLRVDRILPPAADLSITKSDSPDPLLTGANLIYTLTIRNNGPDGAVDVRVTDTLPPETTFRSCSSTTGDCVCGGANNNRTATFAALANGATQMVSLAATIACSVADRTYPVPNAPQAC